MYGWGSRLGSTARGYGQDWQRLRAAVLMRDLYLCQCEECKRVGRIRLATEVDHIVPRTKGGTDALENLQAINHACHERKTLRDNGKVPRVGVGIDGWPLA